MKKAFTLAEVLITLTIIGVIAALTIPNLMQRYQEHATVNKVKKFYSTLTNAYTLAVKEYGDASEWDVQSSTADNAVKIYEFLFKNKFKISKNCGLTNQQKCIANNGHMSMYAGSSIYYKFVLEDGTAVVFRGGDTGNDFYVTIMTDINGAKEPNMFGKDIFVFNISDLDGKLYPAGLPKVLKNNNHNFDDKCIGKIGTTTAVGCAAWLIYKGNMDYLHCSDLTWNGKNKCSK